MVALKSDPAELEQRIGHVFSDPSLLKLALTHVSASNDRLVSYQRLEFLGDRVLGLAVSDMLFSAFPQAEEGELSRRLADLVRKESCADVAGDWQVGPYLRLGEAEAHAGGARKTAILGDICEAIIGAVFLDGGFSAARQLVERSFGERMRKPGRSLRDAKTTLQEWAQARGLPTPAYALASRSGPDHAPHFTIAVSVEGFVPQEAGGGSKRIAEQAAAEAFMVREQIQSDKKGSA
jgi:ribonuclease-3